MGIDYHLTALLQIGQHTDSLRRLEADDYIRSLFGEHGAVKVVAQSQEAENASALLSHTDSLGAHYRDIMLHGSSCDELRGEDDTLTAYAAYKDITLHLRHLLLLRKDIPANRVRSLCRANFL